MKTLSLLIAFTLTTLLSYSQEAKTIRITVNINNVLNAKGKVVFSLHSVDTFMKGPGIENAESTIEDGKATVTFNNVTPGTYAIMALHDENENNRMDFDTSGMPKESYGMSNNPMSYGPPQFSEAKFEAGTEDIKLDIRF